MADGYTGISSIKKARELSIADVPHNTFWDTGEKRELKMHRIHSYPAKFPAFITHKALDYAKSKKIVVRRIADVFCGCGTVAFEAQREALAFWGCDINPVATLIARAKSHQYEIKILEKYFEEIQNTFKSSSRAIGLTSDAKIRLYYWYPDNQMRALAKLRNSIYNAVPEGSIYRDFFLCAFSNILKACSRWLTKSIKPQIDPNKIISGVIPSFSSQFNLMLKAYRESPSTGKNHTEIINENFLSVDHGSTGVVDMIITSPPYVTSYEYADLHQLSSLWLGFATNYKDLRNGSIGTTQHDFNFTREVKRLNHSGSEIVFSLFSQDPRAAKSVAKYYLDMQQVADRCSKMLKINGLALFVIGNTKYKGVLIDNAKHLTESLIQAGFSNVSLAKRTISNKILTPYRTPKGRFTRSNEESQVYGEEFVLIAER
ncbi:hypothetical protein [Janthinobacterium sp. P210005]|uniref:hypothetical protein n=1 Tax=Janthinobacterium sp. P210005 TaxID=3112938 RepID=UPI002E25B708|nr:hypothetical protein [Janthinobacterium sp. P210005]